MIHDILRLQLFISDKAFSFYQKLACQTFLTYFVYCRTYNSIFITLNLWYNVCILFMICNVEIIIRNLHYVNFCPMDIMCYFLWHYFSWAYTAYTSLCHLVSLQHMLAKIYYEIMLNMKDSYKIIVNIFCSTNHKMRLIVCTVVK